MTDQNDGTPRNKAELLQRIRDERARLEASLGKLDDAALEAKDQDGWAIKDHVAHLTAWSRRASAGIQGQPWYEALGLTEADVENASEDEINAKIQAHSRGRSVKEVLQEFRQQNDSIIGQIEAMPEDRLFGPQGNERLLGNIIGNTYDHDEQHRGWIEARQRM